MEFKIYNGEKLVRIDNVELKKELIFNRIIKYMIDHNCSSGETLQQSDECLLDAPDVLSEIIDEIIQPEDTWLT